MNKVKNYLIIGVLAFAIEYISFIIIYKFLTVVIVAQTISFIAGLVVSFLGNRHYTFNTKNSIDSFKHGMRAQAGRYMALAIFNLICTNILIYWQVNSLVIDPFIAKILTMAMVVVWNFIIFNKVIFRSQN